MPIRPSIRCAAAAAASLALPALARGQCPEWQPGFHFNGADNAVWDMTVFDDGSGPALFLGGIFSSVGALQTGKVAKWDGSALSVPGAGIGGLYGSVRAFAVFDDGTGPALYAGGDFTSAGGVTVSNVARWAGTSWSALGSGVNDTVSALAVFDDGTGEALFVGGTFTLAGGSPASHVAKWDGANWSGLGAATNGSVRELEIFDDGTGTALYAAGGFTSAGGIPANRVARWDGLSWSVLGSGLTGGSEWISLAAHDDGSGPALFAGGDFTAAGGTPVNHVARWDGSAWTASNAGIVPWRFTFIQDLQVLDDGTGAALYVGGQLLPQGGAGVTGIAKWNGTVWASLDPRMGETMVDCMEVFDSGSGPEIVVGGSFQTAGIVAARNLAVCSGSAWRPFLPDGNGIFRFSTMGVFDDGSGPALYATATGIAGALLQDSTFGRFDGESWSAIPGSFQEGGGPTVPLRVLSFDDGSGPALYVGGNIHTIDGAAFDNIARWDGSAWSEVGKGLPESVNLLMAHRVPSGPVLLAVTSSGVRQWNGSTWTQFATLPNPIATITCLAVFQGAVHAGWRYTCGPTCHAAGVSRWNGSSWSVVGTMFTSFFPSSVTSMCVFDAGSGPALYVTGGFESAGGIPANNVARWNGSTWSAVAPNDTPGFRKLFTFDEGTGSGSALYGLLSNSLLRWDGSSWFPLGTWQGLSGQSWHLDDVAICDDETAPGPALYVGGGFSAVDGVVSANLAKWQSCGPPGVPMCAGDGSAGSCPCSNPGFPGHGCENSASTGGALLQSSGWTSLAVDTFGLTSSGELPSALSIFLQGNVEIASVIFGDGLRCVGGSLKRLYTKSASGGVATVPSASEPSVSVRSAQRGDPLSPGAERHYQTYYRDPSPAFCASPPGNTWNVSNGMTQIWGP